MRTPGTEFSYAKTFARNSAVYKLDIKSEISFLSGTEMKCCSFILKRIRGGLKVMKATPRATELRVEIKTRAF
jgi:hypothetical protein